MSGLIYFNGILLSEKEVGLPLKDRGYLYGEGLFETLKATGGCIPFLPEHLERLFDSLETLRFKLNVSAAKLEFAVYQTLYHNHLKDAYIRLNLSRENKELGDPEPGEKFNLIVMVQPIKKPNKKIMEQGSQAILFKDFKICPSPLTRVKSTNYLPYLTVKRFAQDQGVEEALLSNPNGNLVEGASTNLFLWNGKQWLTPPIGDGALPGVTRRVLLELMKRHKIPHSEQSLTPQDLSGAEEALLTNAIVEILPLTGWEGHPINGGGIGSQTQRLQELLREEIQYRLEIFESERGSKS